MRYIQPSIEELVLIKDQHQQEKDNLVMLELLAEYRINNPDLDRQRTVVRKLKDKLILAEAYFDYPVFKKTECQFRLPGCCNKINHSFSDWVIYGNCCKTCNNTMSRSAKIMEEIILGRKKTAWDELAELEE